MYPQRDKHSSRNTITRNYANSLREMQIKYVKEIQKSCNFHLHVWSKRTVIFTCI